MIEKLQQLVGVHYQLGSNGADDLKAFQEDGHSLILTVMRYII